MRIQLRNATVKALHTRRHPAYQQDDIRLVRRSSVLLDLMTRKATVPGLCERWGLSPAGLDGWQKALLLHRMDSVVYHHSGGRPAKLPPSQKQRLLEWRDAGPLGVGCETAWWPAVLRRVLIWRACGVLSKRHDVCTVLHNGGASFQKARVVSDYPDVARRQAWLTAAWPKRLRPAKRRQGLILFEDAARVAQWGSWSSTWARRGQQPEGTTSGKRKGSQVFGAIESFAGRLFSQGIEGRFPAESAQGCWRMSMARTTAPLFLIHDGAQYHSRQATTQCLDAHRKRITGHPLPSYAPDDHPMAYLWKQTKQRAPHNQYFKAFA